MKKSKGKLKGVAISDVKLNETIYYIVDSKGKYHLVKDWNDIQIKKDEN